MIGPRQFAKLRRDCIDRPNAGTPSLIAGLLSGMRPENASAVMTAALASLTLETRSAVVGAILDAARPYIVRTQAKRDSAVVMLTRRRLRLPCKRGAWQQVLALARAFDWTPAGTIPPRGV